MIANLFDVQKEIVIITGVSGQLGAEYAKAFLDNGATVVGLDMSLSDRITNLMNIYQSRFHFFKSNIIKKKELESILQEIESKIGVPTVLINNAAIDSPPSAPPEENGPFENYPEVSWDRVMEVNLKGVFLCCQIFGAAMAKAPKGSIINIASIYGVVSPDQNLYEYRRKRGEEFYKPKNIRVNSLTIAGVYNNQEQEFLDVYCSRIPVGRMANIDEYNGSILFLASDASKYMTGHNLVVDGGWTAI